MISANQMLNRYGGRIVGLVSAKVLDRVVECFIESLVVFAYQPLSEPLTRRSIYSLEERNSRFGFVRAISVFLEPCGI
jgi:hypothetical protein